MASDLVGPTDTRSPGVKAANLATHVTTISLMMVLPAWGGYYVDNYFGTLPLCMILGLILGMTAGVWQLTKLVQVESLKNREPTTKNGNDEPSPPN